MTEPVKVLVTGGSGKVGREVIAALVAAGHEPTCTDNRPALYGTAGVSPVGYVRADLTDFGQTTAAITAARPEVVVHAAGIPDPSHDPPHVVFGTNVQATFNVTEAAVRAGVRRLVYVSSETAPGFVTAERPFLPQYLPVDEDHPELPQDAYALSKYVGEQIVAAATRRADISAVSIRPSIVAAAEDYAFLQDIAAAPISPFPNQWSYVDVGDLAGLIVSAVLADTTGHEVVYAAQPDNFMGRPLSELVELAYGADAPPLREHARSDASGISSAKAAQLFGWTPKRSWRDHLRTDALAVDQHEE